MKRKLLSMLMALVMVIGLLPTAAFAAENTINAVAVTVDAPVAGRTPDYSIGLPENANYEVLTDYELENGIVDGTFWQTTSGGSSGSGTILTSDTAFTANTEYEVTVYLVAKEGYEFNASATAAVNDKSTGVTVAHNIHESIMGLAPGRDIVTVSYTFTAKSPADYAITAGESSEFNKQGSADELSITADADFDKFEGVEVDGSEIDESNYTVESGSTIVKLNKDYLNTLSVGQHSLEMLFSDGSASTTFTIADEEVTLKTVTIPVHKFVTANVAPGAKDFTASMKLLDANGGDVSEEMGFVVTDNTISTDGTHLATDYTEESISFTVPADKYDSLLACTLEVKENAVEEKGWTVDSSTITVSFASGETEDALTFDCDGSVLDNLNYIYLSNTYEICKITIPVVKTVRVNGNGTAPETDFELNVEFPYAPEGFELGEGAIEATIETDGAGTYVDSVTITMTKSEFEAACTEGTFAAVLSEVNDAEDGWNYSPLEIIALATGWVVNSLGEGEGDLEVPAGTISTESAAVFSYYPYVEGNIDTAHQLDYPIFENTYTAPVPVVITIPVVKTVRVIGNGTAPAADFEIDVEFPYAPDNFELGEGAIEATIETDDAGTYVDSVTITMTQSEFEATCTEGTFAAILSEVNDAEDGWDYSPLKIIALASGWVVNSLDEGDLEVPAGTISTESAAVFSYYPYVDDDIDENHKLNYPMFENTYTAPVNYTIEIPFTKEVKLGGNRSEARDFDFELLTPFYQGELDMKVEGTTVETNGKGTYEGKLTITVAEEDLYNLTEGMVLVEKNTGAANWTYDDTAWFIGLNFVQVNSLDEDRSSVSAPNYELSYNKAEKIEGDDGDTYRPTNDRADKIVFTNTYTKNVSTGGSGSAAPSKPVLNKEDHFAFLAGYTDGTFGPNRNMTRGEVATMFARLLTDKIDMSTTYENSFSDVPADYWAYNYIGYVQKYGLISGYTDGTFRPDAPITRAEFATIACRFEELTEGTKTFSDVPETYWAYRFISYAAERGWVTGYTDGTFKPDNYITRAEVVTVTCRLLERNADKDYINKNIDDLKTFPDVDEGHWAYWFVMEATNGHDYTKKNDKETWSSLHK